jgi:hypothetical protein
VFFKKNELFSPIAVGANSLNCKFLRAIRLQKNYFDCSKISA